MKKRHHEVTLTRSGRQLCEVVCWTEESAGVLYIATGCTTLTADITAEQAAELAGAFAALYKELTAAKEASDAVRA